MISNPLIERSYGAAPARVLMKDGVWLVPEAERLASNPRRCSHECWQKYGRSRRGNQRMRCKLCGKIRQLGADVNPRWVQMRETLLQSWKRGLSIHQAAIHAGSSEMTACTYYQSFRRQGIVRPTTCGCGRALGHRGWCRVRFQASPSRQRLLTAWHAKQRHG